MLVSEHAATSIETVLLMVEGSAVLGLQFLVVDLRHEVGRELVVAVSKFALLAISAHADFNPVLAELGLVFDFRVIVLKFSSFRGESTVLG